MNKRLFWATTADSRTYIVEPRERRVIEEID